MKILILGATGLVGKNTLQLCLNDPRVSQVIAPTRRALPAHPKLLNPLVDFAQLPNVASWWSADAVLCALGTTIKKAGSQEAFTQVDYEYPLKAAQLALAHGTSTYVLNSAMGANADSKVFYNRTKGKLENSLRNLGFQSLTLVRPGLITGERDEYRRGEEFAKVVSKVLKPVLPKKFQPNPAPKIAEQMVAAALDRQPGTHIITSDKMTE